MSEIVISHQTKARYWGEFIAEQQRSGKSISAFCRERGVNHHTFRYWRAKSACNQHRDLPERFIAIAKSASFSARAAKIILPNGVQIDLGASLESVPVAQIIFNLCGVTHLSTEGRRAKS